MIESLFKALTESRNALVVVGLITLLLVVLVVVYWTNVVSIGKAIHKELTRGARLERRHDAQSKENAKNFALMLKKLGDTDRKIDKVEYEVSWNTGGSIKDAVKRIEGVVSEISSMDDFKFRREKIPAFQCTLDGKNIKVTNAYLYLLGLFGVKALSSVNWSSYMHEDDRKAYKEEFEHCVSTESDFLASARFHKIDLLGERESVGEWRVQATVLDGGKGLYYGFFTPVDTLAKSIFEENGWVLP